MPIRISRFGFLSEFVIRILDLFRFFGFGLWWLPI